MHRINNDITIQKLRGERLPDTAREYAYGPLPKSIATIEIESLIADIINNYGKSDTRIVLNDQGEYEITLNSKVVNISFILKYAHLGQLKLDNQLLEAINNILRESLTQYTESPLGEGATTLMQPAHRNAIHFYSKANIDSQLHYTDIGKFFRGEEVKNTSSALHCFLIGCVIIDAVNRIPYLLDDEKLYPSEKAILNKIQIAKVVQFRQNKETVILFLDQINDETTFKMVIQHALKEGIINREELGLVENQYEKLKPLLGSYGKIYRSEKLTPEQFQERIESDVMQLPSASSYTYSEEKKLLFGDYLSILPAPRTASVESISGIKDEAEVLIAPGFAKYDAVPGQPKTATVRLIESPDTPDMFWIEHALRFANKHRLTKAYQDQSDKTPIGIYFVERPNHGSPHTYRVSWKYVPLVTSVLAEHANETFLKMFCQTIDSKTMTWLRIAGIFSVTGREGEVAYKDNPQLYNSYRKKCVDDFNQYLDEHHPLPDDPDRDRSIERMRQIILHLGKPDYDDLTQGIVDEKERETLKCLYAILNVSHKLDLPRCQSYGQFQKSFFEFFDKLVIKSRQQEIDLNLMLNFATTLIMDHGDIIHFIIDKSGIVHYTTQTHYLPHFGALNHHLPLLLSGKFSPKEIGLPTLNHYLAITGKTDPTVRRQSIIYEYQLTALSDPSLKNTKKFIEALLKEIWPENFKREVEFFITTAGNRLVVIIDGLDTPAIAIHRDFLTLLAEDQIAELAFAIERELQVMMRYGASFSTKITAKEDYLVDKYIIDKRKNAKYVISYLRKYIDFYNKNQENMFSLSKDVLDRILVANPDDRIKMAIAWLAKSPELNAERRSETIPPAVVSEVTVIKPLMSMTNEFNRKKNREEKFAYLIHCLPSIKDELIPFEFTEFPSTKVRKFCGLLKELKLDLHRQRDLEFINELMTLAFDQKIPSFEYLYLAIVGWENYLNTLDYNISKNVLPLFGVFYQYQTAITSFIEAKDLITAKQFASEVIRFSNRLKNHFMMHPPTEAKKHLTLFSISNAGQFPQGDSRFFGTGIGRHIQWRGFTSLDDTDPLLVKHLLFAEEDSSRQVADALWELGVIDKEKLWDLYTSEELLKKIEGTNNTSTKIFMILMLSRMNVDEYKFIESLKSKLLAYQAEKHTPQLHYLYQDTSLKEAVDNFIDANLPMLVLPGFSGRLNIDNLALRSLLEKFSFVAKSGSEEDKAVVKKFFLENRDENPRCLHALWLRDKEVTYINYCHLYMEFILHQKFQDTVFSLFTLSEKLKIINMFKINLSTANYLELFELNKSNFTLPSLKTFIKLAIHYDIGYVCIREAIELHIKKVGPYQLISPELAEFFRLIQNINSSNIFKLVFVWGLPDMDAETKGVNLSDLTLIYHTIDCHLLFPNQNEQTKFSNLILNRILTISDINIRIQAIQSLLCNRDVRLNTKLSYYPPLSDYTLRSRLIDQLARDLLLKYGEDTGNRDYAEKIKNVINNLITIASARDVRDILLKISDSLVTQHELSLYIANLLGEASTSSIKNQDIEHAEQYSYLNILVRICCSDDELRMELIQFLINPLTNESSDQLYTALIKSQRHISARDLLDLLPAGQEKESLKVMLIGIYHAFWGQKLELRAVMTESLFIPPAAVSTEATQQAAYRVSVDYLISRFFPNAAKDEDEDFAQHFVKAYLETANPYYRSYLLAGMLVATKESSQNPTMRTGKKLAMLCEHLGPAYIKLAQAIHSHPSTPVHIRDDLSHVKGRASPPTRWQLWLSIDSVLSDRDKERLIRLGPMLGSASYNIGLVAELIDGTKAVLLLLRQDAEKMAEEGFSHLEKTALACHHAKMTDLRQAMIAILNEARSSSHIEMDNQQSAIQYLYASRIYQWLARVNIDDQIQYEIEMQPVTVLSCGPGYRFLDYADGIEFNDLPEETAADKKLKSAVAAAIIHTELINIFSGKYFDSDRHGNQMRVLINHEKKRIQLGLYDFGELSLEKASNQEIESLARVIRAIPEKMTPGNTLDKIVDSIINEEIDSCRHRAIPVTYLMKVRKAFLALQDYQRQLTQQDILQVFQLVSTHKRLHPELKKELRDCIGKLDKWKKNPLLFFLSNPFHLTSLFTNRETSPSAQRDTPKDDSAKKKY